MNLDGTEGAGDSPVLRLCFYWKVGRVWKGTGLESQRLRKHTGVRILYLPPERCANQASDEVANLRSAERSCRFESYSLRLPKEKA